MNDLLAIASAVRERYLEALLESFAAFADEHHPSAMEVMFELQRDEALPYRLYRADMAADNDGSPVVRDVIPSSYLSFEPFGVEFAEGTSAAVRPFVWYDVCLQFNTTMPVEPIEEWAMRWLDMGDHSPKDEHGLQGAIHSIVREDAAGGSTLLVIDFGSAPVEALRELIDLAFESGVSHVSLFSQTLQ